MQRKTLTILFIDVQGYTSRTGRQSREENEIFVKEVKSFVDKHIKEKGGTFIKAMGDGFLASFESPTDAVNCGTEMQKNVEQRNANVLNENNFIRFRIGISTGEVAVDENGDVYGDAVNIAARIEKFAAPNEVFISESTYLAMNKSEIKAMDLGPQRFKNVLQEVRVYKVVKDGKETPAIRTKPKQKLPLVIIIMLGILTAVGIAILILLLLAVGKRRKERYDFPRPQEERRFDQERPDIRQLMKQGDYTTVVEWCKKQLQKDPDNIRLYELASRAYLEMHDYGQAEQHLMRAIEIDPERAALYYKMANVYEEAGEYQDAIGMLEEYIHRGAPPSERRKAKNKIKELQEKL